jgi:trimeric autotransporter adhesin
LTSGNSVTISTPVYSKADTMTLTATATSGETSLTAATSGNIVFSAGATTQLVFTTQPGGGTGGTAWTTQPVVMLEDAGGNTVTGTAQNVTLAIQNNAGPGGVLSGTTAVAVNTGTGLDTFSGCRSTRPATATR